MSFRSLNPTRVATATGCCRKSARGRAPVSNASRCGISGDALHQRVDAIVERRIPVLLLKIRSGCDEVGAFATDELIAHRFRCRWTARVARGLVEARADQVVAHRAELARGQF